MLQRCIHRHVRPAQALRFFSSASGSNSSASGVFDLQSWTPLMHATSVQEAQAAIKTDDVNFACKYGWTPLIVQSFMNRDAGIVDLLLEQKGLDCNAQNNASMGATALMLASEEGHADIVAALLKHPKIQCNKQDNNGNTALMLAAQAGHADVVKLLLEHPSIDCAIKSNDDTTALTEACEAGHIDVVRQLLAHPAVIHHLENDKEGIVSWIFAADEGHLDIIKLLLEQTAIYHSGLPLLVAATTGQKEVVELLLAKEDIDCNATDDLGISALMLASDGGHADIVQLLIAHPDIDCNMQDCHGISALISATMSGHTDIVEILLQHPSINCNLQDKEHGATALMVACQEGYIDIAEMLVPHSDLSLPNKDGCTARDFAEAFNHLDIVDVLDAK